jgi:hypothetical protein
MMIDWEFIFIFGAGVVVGHTGPIIWEYMT